MPHLCIKPQCSNHCDGCNCAIDQADSTKVLVLQLLNAFAVDGFGGPLEDGESELIDRARAFLARAAPPAPTTPTVWAFADKTGKLIASSVRQPEPGDLAQYDEIWPEAAPHAVHEFVQPAPELDQPDLVVHLRELAARTGELIDHLKSTGRLRPCFNLPALDSVRRVLGSTG